MGPGSVWEKAPINDLYEMYSELCAQVSCYGMIPVGCKCFVQLLEPSKGLKTTLKLTLARVF